jgi:hypothetical protein
MMTQYGSKHVININVNNLCYYFYLNCCVDGYKYAVLNDTKRDEIRKNFTIILQVYVRHPLCINLLNVRPRNIQG